MANINLAERIRFIMKQNNFTQKNFAENLGISQPAVSLYLRGRIPPADILFHIAQLGNTSVEWLLTGIRSNETTNIVKEKKSYYGNKYLLLKLWEQMPQNLQYDILSLLRHLLEYK
jgi:transcriptional regulator with XRE-family HTH domain